ncbi:MAG: RNA polymerase sigma-70 factor [Anaerolineaceae bacterium]|nr:RNA polymerase sigma-70 factor [Anaerolineaceae bacterium]
MALVNNELYEQYRHLLFSIAYRMLGSAMEAEDMVQEAFLRYENVGDKEIQSPKAYLTTIVTRLCLDQLKSAKTQREQYVGTWLPEPIFTEQVANPEPEETETLSMAFMVLLENLSPVERAVFLLREVFDYDYAAIANIVNKSEVNCRRYYHLAKQYLVERRPRFEPSSDAQTKLVYQFMQAVSEGNMDGLTHVLSEDIVMYADSGGKAPAARIPQRGHQAVIRLLLGVFRLTTPDMRYELHDINGSISLMVWQADALILVMNFEIVNNQITGIRNILNPDKLAFLAHSDTPNEPIDLPSVD